MTRSENHTKKNVFTMKNSLIVIGIILLLVIAYVVGINHAQSNEALNKTEKVEAKKPVIKVENKEAVSAETTKTDETVAPVQQKEEVKATPVPEPKVISLPPVKKTPVTPKETAYNSYYNDRFGFGIQYPKGMTLAQPPDNGDGQRFFNDELVITAYGGNTNIINTDESAATYYQEDLNRISEEIAYKKLGNDWYVISYEKDGLIIYKKFFFRGSIFNTFEIKYPANKKEKYDPIVTHIVKTFIMGDGYQ
jgi:hypothetical protein